ncbi:MAG: preprotein translocase subunit SecG [Gammaproteobacteria bacterium]
MMFSVLLAVHLVLALLLIGIILLQQGKGATAGAAFGSGASATVFGARGSASFLSRTTAILATLFLLNSLLLANLYGARVDSKSLLDTVDLPTTAVGADTGVTETPAVPAAPVLNEHFSDLGMEGDDIVVVSPDEGSIKRALGHSKRLGGTLAIVDKRRTSALEVRQSTIIGGPVDGKVALLFDDMISTAGSICGAARLVHEAGAREIHIAATHGVMCGPAIEKLRDAPIDSIVVTDSIPIPAEKQLPNLVELTVAPLLAEAIKRIHHDQSISELFRER